MTSTASTTLRVRMLLTVALYIVFGVAFTYAMAYLWGRMVPAMIGWWAQTYDASAELGMYTLAFVGIAILYLAYASLTNLYLTPIGETNAHSADEESYPELHGTVERLALEMDLPKPDVGIVESPVPNAYTYGLFPSRSTLVVTAGVLDDLDEDEREAVIAHELAHISHRDAAVMSIGFLLPAVTFAFARAITMPFDGDDPHSRSSSHRRSSGSSGPVFIPSGGDADEDTLKALLVLLAIIIVTAVLTFAISAIFWLFTSLTLVLLSRTRELAADRAAAAVTGNPHALESALRTIHGRMDDLPAEDLREIDGAVETVYFASLDRGVFERKDAVLLSDDIFPDTHPTIDRRVEAIREFAPGQ